VICSNCDHLKIFSAPAAPKRIRGRPASKLILIGRSSVIYNIRPSLSKLTNYPPNGAICALMGT